jgi:alkylresorcinol/alkylpyrone synthase
VAAPVPSLLSIATRTPDNVLTTDDFTRLACRIYGPRTGGRLVHLQPYAGVSRRFLALPVEDLLAHGDIESRNGAYRDVALDLGRSACGEAIARSGADPAAISLFVTVSCTGHMVPSLDAHLALELGLRTDVRRLPISQIGCGAGAAGLGLVREYLAGNPGPALLLAAEFCSLTFQPHDDSLDGLMAALLFGDGVAAAVVGSGEGPLLVDSREVTLPESECLLGWDLRNDGFHIVLKREIEQVLEVHLPGVVSEFLASHELRVSDVGFWAVHPGGRNLLDTVGRTLALPAGALAASYEVLDRYGNMSSPSVLFVLELLMRTGRLAGGQVGVVVGFGPGFSIDLVLLKMPG